jgi:hypothetical protein
MRRSAVVVSGAVTAVACAAGGALAASTGTGITTGQTIRLLEGGPFQQRFVDLNGKGFTLGDYLVFNTTLRDLSGKVVGSADGYSLVTRLGKGGPGGLHLVTVTLPGGQITTQNAELPTVSHGYGPEAITGGTGRYQNVRGQLTFERHGRQVQVVLHLLP